MELLMKLMDAHGVSAQEDEVRNIIETEIKKYVDEVKTDKLGNLIARKDGKKPRIMLAAHMDEIGLMVKGTMGNGFLRCSMVGEIEPLLLIGQRVQIRTRKGTISGVITTREISDRHEIEELPKVRDLLVDTGLSEKEIKKFNIEPGDYISPEEKPGFLGSKDIICGKALDDRIGCYVLIEVAKLLRKAKSEIYYVFTVQEEVGLYGAKTSSYEVNPNWAIAVDTVNANDCSAPEYITKSIGKGPCISVKDESMIADRHIVDMLKETAMKEKIPVQLEVSNFGTTDALTISITRGGVPSAALNIPIRNLHSTIGVTNVNDIKNAITLLYELLKAPPEIPAQWR